MKKTIKHISDYQHLTSYQISVAADTILANQFDALENEIAEHVEVCSQCKSDILSLIEVLNQMSSEEVALLKPSEDLETNKVKQFKWAKWLAAASIVLLAATSIVFWQKSNIYKSEFALLQKSLDGGIGVIANDKIIDSLQLELDKQNLIKERAVIAYSDSVNQLSLDLEIKSKLLALAYENNKSFEDQVNMDLRSASIQVKTPKYIEKAYGNTVELIWEAEVPMGIAVYNNKGVLIFKESGLNASFSLKPDLLLPGVYYWKLIGEEGVVFIGKISLK